MSVVESLGALAARVLLSFMFILAGWDKLNGFEGAMAYAASAGIPSFLVLPMIAIELCGGLAILVGWQTRWAAFALGAFALLTGVFYHYGPTQGLAGQDLIGQIINWRKNLTIAGGFLALAVLGPGRYSVDEMIGQRLAKA